MRYVKSLFANIQNTLKNILLFKNVQISWANNWRILGIKNTKFSGYCFYMNKNMYGDFQICISVHVILNHRFDGSTLRHLKATRPIAMT